MIKSAMHSVTSALEIPAIVILLLAVIIVVGEFGSIVVEFFVCRFRKKLNVTKILEQIDGRTNQEIWSILRRNDFQKSQKKAFEQFLKGSTLSKDANKLVAVQLLSEEMSRHERILYITDLIARIAPMFGLMSTLIPLGPGLIALGGGDTVKLSESLLTAFDATIAGLAAAGVAFIISKIRKRWYQSDIDAMETILEGLTQ